MSNLRTGDDHRFAVGDAIARARLLEKMVADKPQAAEAQPLPASRFLSGGLVAAFVVGTGGLLTADYVAARNDHNLWPWQSHRHGRCADKPGCLGNKSRPPAQ